MTCQVTLRLPDEELVVLGHGDLIGRLWSAALALDDPRVSEAHALVSLRGHEVKLLGLRGRFAVDGVLCAEATLKPGQRIAFAEGLEIEVVGVERPEIVLGLACEGMPPRALPGTCALIVDPAPAFAPPTHRRAVAHVWALEDGWRIRPIGGVARDLDAGVRVTAGGVTWEAVEIALDGGATTTPTRHAADAPLHVLARYDTVHIFRDAEAPAFLNGLCARLVSELVALGGPVHWSLLCNELWGPDGSRKQLDMTLVRLRRKLRAQGIRPDLVRTDGAGRVELFLHPQDRVEEHA